MLKQFVYLLLNKINFNTQCVIQESKYYKILY